MHFSLVQGCPCFVAQVCSWQGVWRHRSQSAEGRSCAVYTWRGRGSLRSGQVLQGCQERWKALCRGVIQSPWLWQREKQQQEAAWMIIGVADPRSSWVVLTQRAAESDDGTVDNMVPFSMSHWWVVEPHVGYTTCASKMLKVRMGILVSWFLWLWAWVKVESRLEWSSSHFSYIAHVTGC